ncbi:MAG TPA: class I SAM-dependent methyltransferase [Firmicutes bacterium]|nr:class I SAM-dependent methyltransferase [Bacillota bacterium]
MKENRYDEEIFFKKYSQFPRSVQGLRAAGEWHELEAMLPDFSNKRILDIGCGFGWHCMYAAEHGAKQVVGTDISCKMLEVARQKHSSSVITYQQVAMEDLEFPPASFDVVLSSLALHYTPEYSLICDKVYRFLSPGGFFVFSVEHPVFTAYGNQDWIYNEQGNPDHWPVDRYFVEGERQAVFLGETVKKYHRTLTTYLGELINRGFSIERVVEPQPQPHLLETVPGMREELRRPMMLLIRAVKKQ